MKRKWNWIDSTIVILVVLAIFAFINRDKILGGNTNNSSSNKKNIVMTVEVRDLAESMITDLKVGDKIFSQNKLQNAEIKEIVVEPITKLYVRDDGTLAEIEEQGINIEVKVEAEVITSGPYMDLGGQEVKTGIPFILKTTSVEYLGDIKNIEVK